MLFRTPEWLKKIFATVTKSERNGPVFRFFMDLGDAGMVEICFITSYIFWWFGKIKKFIADFWEQLFFLRGI